MNDQALYRLFELANVFLSGKNRSIGLVNEIEAVLIENFLDTELFEELTEALALYNPGGGSHYVDEDEMAQLLADALGNLPRDPGLPPLHKA